MSPTIVLTLAFLASLASGIHGSLRLPPQGSLIEDMDQEPEKNGPTCGQYRKICAAGSTCEDGRCTCPEENPVGFGYFDCVPKDWLQCRVCGDPHLEGYKGAMTALNIPCRYRMTSIKTPSSFTLNQFCKAKVFGTNVYRNGRFYAEIVDGDIEIVRVIGSDRLFRFQASREGVTITAADTAQTVYAEWGKERREVDIFGIKLVVSFDTVQNYVLISLAKCYLRIKFRFPNRDSVGQNRVPCITVSTIDYKIFPWSFHVDGNFPAAMCGKKSNNPNLFKEEANRLGLAKRDYAALHAWLTNPVEQNQGDEQSTCSSIIDDFGDCDRKKTDAINKCAPILYDKDLLKCLHQNNVKNVLDIFRDCIRGFCIESGEGCKRSEKALEVCRGVGPEWVHNQNCGENSDQGQIQVQQVQTKM